MRLLTSSKLSFARIRTLSQSGLGPVSFGLAIEGKLSHVNSLIQGRTGNPSLAGIETSIPGVATQRATVCFCAAPNEWEAPRKLLFQPRKGLWPSSG